MFINKSKCQNTDCNQCCQYCYVIGPTGPTGPAGSPGEELNYADFYALMPPDNAATVAQEQM